MTRKYRRISSEVRRKHVFIGGIRKIGRPNFKASLPLSVKFADELGSSDGAVDFCRPTRKFLRLAVQSVFSSNAFAGPADRKMLVLNQESKPFLFTYNSVIGHGATYALFCYFNRSVASFFSKIHRKFSRVKCSSDWIPISPN